MIIEGNKNMLKHATDFDRDLFGPAPGNLCKIDGNMWDDKEKLGDIGNFLLLRPFSDTEVKHSLFLMKHNKAPRPDNIPIDCFQSCWEIVKEDVMSLFYWFHENNLEVERINYGIITLLPKVAGADKMQQFTPICLLRCIYKLITKVLTIRLEPHVDILFSRHQNAFIKNRDIMDGIMSLHEILHHTYAKNKKGIVLKLDFEKAYDKVNWEFLLDCHSKRNFDPRWIDWIRRILVGGTISVKLNDEVGEYFQSAKGVRQGDPVSPFLFNLAADCLTKMVLKAQANGLFTGLAADLVENGVAILQYADDTILCFEDNVSNALNIKSLLYLFEIMSGLKINFLKSEILLVGADDDTMRNYADMSNCEIGAFPIKYLGMHVSYAGLKCSDWLFVDDKFISHGESWISESLSSGGRLIKVNAVLSHIPSYYMSMALIKNLHWKSGTNLEENSFGTTKGERGIIW
uniref:Reverse transcriptase domain-containing protein n=1 Tax=Hordeum vulgare subsp. vulgare TaxID=112509 RepID=A0A8I6XWR9_HORVV